MESNENSFSGTVTYSAQTVRQMEKVRNRTFNLMTSVVRIVCAGVMVVCGYMTGGKAGTAFVAFGCILAVSSDIIGRWRCEQTVRALGGRTLSVTYRFYETEFLTEVNGQASRCTYAELICLMEDDRHYYLFPNEHQLYMMQKDTLQPAKAETFREMIAKKSGLSWLRPLSLLTVNLKQLVQFQRAVNQKRGRPAGSSGNTGSQN